MYVVVSSPSDEHIALVEKHLDEPFVVLNTRDILEFREHTYALAGKQTTLTRDNRQLKDVKSVWYRRSMLLHKEELPVREEHADFSLEAIKRFNELVFNQFSDALWISSYYAIRRANDKFWQLQVASRLGFNVPDTIMTNSGQKALEFTKRHDAVIAKPAFARAYRHKDTMRAFYTTKVDATTDFSGLSMAPAIIQQAIMDIEAELRITVVRDKVFAASVVGDTEGVAGHLRDWRPAGLLRDVTVREYDLPPKIAKLCVAHVKEMGLEFGAIDMIVDKKGKYWFLENNPNGQWGFVELATGQPIGKAIAELLMAGK